MKNNSKEYITIPNLFTTLNLFCGFVSITSTANGHYAIAGWVIFMAGIFDALDGRLARAFGTSSEFGLQMDSLGDVVAAGIAPSFLVYEFYLKSIGPNPVIGLVLSFLPLLFAAFRLARFNIAVRENGKDRNFSGMPAPMAASSLSSIVVLYQATEWFFLLRLLVFMVPVVGLLMASNLHYDGFPRFSIRERGANRFKLFVLIVSILLVLFFPEYTFFAFMMIYVLSGPVHFIFELLNFDRADIAD